MLFTKKLPAEKRALRAMAACVGVSALIACSPARDEAAVLTADEIATAERGIDGAREGFERAIAAGDMQALGGLLAEDAIMVQPGAADWALMREAAASAPFPKGATIRITPIETKVIDAEWAYEFGSSVITYPDAATGDEIELRDTYIMLLRNEGDGWKPYREVASASPPPRGWPAEKSALEN